MKRPNNSDNGGFDIVIGNPPYISIRTKSFDVNMKETFKHNYSLAIGQYDLYILFIELANKILNNKGILSFIVPTRLLSNENFQQARIYLMKNIPIINYANVQMPFENANVETNIMICSKIHKNHTSIYYYNPEKKIFDFSFNFLYSQIIKMPFSILPFVYTQKVLSVFNKIQETKTIKLEDYVSIIRGFECGYNDKNIGHGKKMLIPSEAIHSYYIDTKKIINCNPDFTIPKIYKTKEVFETIPKLITKFCANEIKFAIDIEGFYNTNSVYNCIPKINNSEQLKYLLAVLNSRLTTFWFNTAFMNIDNLFPHIQKNQLENIPIPLAQHQQYQEIINVVNEILSTKESSPETDISVLEAQINTLVYKLYDLSPEEIEIIEGQ